MNDIPRLCAEAARAWNAMLKDDVMDDIKERSRGPGYEGE